MDVIVNIAIMKVYNTFPINKIHLPVGMYSIVTGEHDS